MPRFPDIPLPKLNRFQLSLLAAAAIVIAVVAFVCFVPKDRSDTATREVAIASGQGVSEIAGTLRAAGIIRSATAFTFYARATGVQSQLQAGRYLLSPSMSTAQVVSQLAWGGAEPNDITVVIPEGENVWEIDQILTNAGLITQGEFARAYRADEGYFFPDTYRFAPDATVDEIAQRMKWNFTAKVSPFVDRATVTVASLLEKEGKTEADKAIIAGIIQKRIDMGMPLQIDAAVAYGACLRTWLVQSSTADCDVTKVPIAYELGIDSEYNTYLRTGLPAGPIANPGLDAITAAQNPTVTDYLYYLSPRDGSRIIFSKTATEHVQNRKKYLGI